MIIRSYYCNDCNHLFEVQCKSNDGDPACPFCEAAMQWRPQSFSIKTNKSRAMDLTQNIIEQDFGLTDFNDNTREGETVAKTPVAPTTADREKEAQAALEFGDMIEARQKSMGEQQLDHAPPGQQAAVRNFFGPSGAAGPIASQSMVGSSLIAAAKSGPAALGARDGVDPMGALHRLGKEGKLPSSMRIVARARMDGSG